MKGSRTRPGYHETPVKCPKSLIQTVAYIPKDTVTHFLKYGPSYKFYEIQHNVRETLADSDACYRYRKDEFPGFCYTRNIDYRYTNEGCRVPSEPGFVYVVFLTEKLILADFGFEHCDELERCKPLVAEFRLEEAIWCNK